MFRCSSRTSFLGLATSLVCVRTVSAAALVRPALGTSTHAAAVLLARRSSMSGSGSLEQQIQDNISSNKVLVYSKSTCPFCSQTKGLFQEMGVDATYIELDELTNGPEVQAALQGISGQRTVPNVFINGKHLGGNDDTQKAARSGKLKELLAG